MNKIVLFGILVFYGSFIFSQSPLDQILSTNNSSEVKFNKLLEISEDLDYQTINVDSVKNVLFRDKAFSESQQSLLLSKLYLINKDAINAISELNKVQVNTLPSLKNSCEWFFIKGRLAVVNNPDSSLYFLSKAYDLALEIQDDNLIYRSLRYLGEESVRNSNYIQAIEYYEKAMRFGFKIDSVQKTIDYNISLGRIAKYTEDYERLVEINEGLMNNYSKEEIGWKKKIIYNNLAVGYADSKEYLKSIEYQVKTLDVSDSVDVAYNITLLNLATCILDSYEYDENSSDQLILFFNEIDFLDKYLNQDIMLFSKKDLFKLTNDLIHVSMSFFNQRSSQAFNPYLKNALGRLYLNQEEYKKAETLLLEAQDLSIKANDINLVKEIASVLSELYHKIGSYKLAYEWKEKSTRIGDSLSLSKQQTKIGYLLATKEYENKNYLDSLNQVQAINIAQVEVSKKEKIKSIINLFVIVAFLLVIIIVYLFYRRRKLKVEHEMLSLEQNLLRTQMNPHFIFNSLTTISGFVLKNKNDVSYNYISKFAKLMRLILDSSRKEYISLNEEIEIVSSFLALHKLNSKNTLNFIIDYDKGLLDEEIEVPPMLLQPFIENAVKYGYNSETKETFISVSFALDGEMLTCIVKDDGEGFRENTTSNSKSSHAINITNERIENIKKQYKKTISLSIGNQNIENDNSLGAVVVLKIQV